MMKNKERKWKDFNRTWSRPAAYKTYLDTVIKEVI